MADSAERSRVKGFFSSLWSYRDKAVWSWDLLGTVVVLVLVWSLPTDRQVDAWLTTMGSTAVALASALVGVVVAGLAVVVALLDDELLALMERDTASGRVAGHIFPYWFVAGLGVTTILLGALLQVVGNELLQDLRRPALALEAGLLTWTALGVFNLVGSLNGLGINRALAAKLKAGKRPET